LYLSKIATAKAELRRLQLQYEMTDSDVQALCDFPESTPPRVVEQYHVTNPDDIARFSDVPHLLDEEGQHLHIVEAGPRLLAGGKQIHIHASFHTYLQNTEGGVWVVTVPGVPSLYADGCSPEEAVNELLTLMVGFHADLSASPDAREGGDVARLRQFLEKVLGASAEPAVES
jgi:predicted RNase H-like HicB family nuclease